MLLTVVLFTVLVGLRVLAIRSLDSRKPALRVSAFLAFLILSVFTWCRFLDVNLMEETWRQSTRCVIGVALGYCVGPAMFLIRDAAVLNHWIEPRLGLLIELIIWTLWSVSVITISLVLKVS